MLLCTCVCGLQQHRAALGASPGKSMVCGSDDCAAPRAVLLLLLLLLLLACTLFLWAGCNMPNGVAVLSQAFAVQAAAPHYSLTCSLTTLNDVQRKE